MIILAEVNFIIMFPEKKLQNKTVDRGHFSVFEIFNQRSRIKERIKGKPNELNFIENKFDNFEKKARIRLKN